MAASLSKPDDARRFFTKRACLAALQQVAIELSDVQSGEEIVLNISQFAVDL